MKTSRNAAGFTLVELMISGGIAGVILTSVVIGGVVLQKVFSATSEYYEAQTNQARILDYIARDIRRGQVLGPSAADFKAGTVSNNGAKVLIRMPDYTDGAWPDSLKTAANADAKRVTPYIETTKPAFGRPQGCVYYGGKKTAVPGTPSLPKNYIEVEYYTVGQKVMRKETVIRNAVETSRELVISNDVESFQLLASDPDTGSTATFDFPSLTVSSVRTSVKFMPRFRGMQTQAAKDGTEIFATTVLRNTD